MSYGHGRSSVLVTGASSGIGKATAARLSREGFEVVITASRSEALEEVRRDIRCEAVAVDVGDAAEVEAAFGKRSFDVLIHCAGILAGSYKIHETPAAEVEKLFRTNVLGTFNIVRSVVPGMAARNRGYVMLLGSVAWRVPGLVAGAYSASKAAVHAMAADLRYDLNGSRVRVCEIVPGRVRTGIYNQRPNGDAFYDGYKCLAPEDIADLVHNILSAPTHVDMPMVEVMPVDQVPGGMKYFKSNQD